MSNQYCSIAPTYRFLPWTLALISLNDGVWFGTIKWHKPFVPELFFSNRKSKTRAVGLHMRKSYLSSTVLFIVFIMHWCPMGKQHCKTWIYVWKEQNWMNVNSLAAEAPKIFILKSFWDFSLMNLQFCSWFSLAKVLCSSIFK